MPVKFLTNQVIFMASLENHMQYMIRKQFNGRTRSQNKHHGAKKADYMHVYSNNSLKTHERAIHKFCSWAKENRIKRIRQINYDVIGNYCLYLQSKGYSAWTIKAGITAINHVMVGTGNWSKNDVFTASKWNKGHDAKFQTLIKRKNRGEIWNNRRQSAEQWRKENETLYENNRSLIDTARAFGLRRSELCHTSKDKPSVISNSFFENKGKLYCFVPYGKGGRPRFATCRNDMENEMRQLYQFQKAKYLPQTQNDIKKFQQVFLKKNEKTYRDNNYIYDGHVSGRLRFHIQRQEYARTRLDEEFKTKGRHSNTQRTINGVKGNETAFRAVAKDLGHGRIDVLGSYI